MTRTSSLLSTAGFGSNRRVPRTLDLAGLESAATVAKWQGRGQRGCPMAAGPIVDMCPKRNGLWHRLLGGEPPTACLGTFFAALRGRQAICEVLLFDPGVPSGRRDRVADTA